MVCWGSILRFFHFWLWEFLVWRLESAQDRCPPLCLLPSPLSFQLLPSLHSLAADISYVRFMWGVYLLCNLFTTSLIWATKCLYVVCIAFLYVPGKSECLQLFESNSIISFISCFYVCCGSSHRIVCCSQKLWCGHKPSLCPVFMLDFKMSVSHRKVNGWTCLFC